MSDYLSIDDLPQKGVKWHTIGPEKALELLHSDYNGLVLEEIDKRRQLFGANQLPGPKKKNPVVVFFNQFNDILIMILVFTVVLSLLLAIGDRNTSKQTEYIIDAVVISIVLLFNALMGFYQEIKASRAIEALTSLIEAQAVVYREGRKYQIPAVEVVPGDIVEIEAGQKIIADLRLIQGQNLRINESSLTGESIPVGKVVDAKLPEKTPLGDRKNLLFMGTLAAYGKGIGVVVNTGLNTEIGKIANLVTKAESLDTPLQSRLEKFSSQLGLGTILIAFLMILLGFSLEFASNSEFDVAQTLVDLVIIGVSLAVAAIPEGLPAVLTLTLAIGVQRMAKRNAICRTLEAVEALGSTTFICTDKTGTLTQNVMSATSFATEGCFYHLEDPMELLVGFKSDFALQDIISVSRLVNTTTLKTSREGSSGYDGVLGDPLDQALFKNVRALQKLVQTQCTDWQKFSELPFDSERKLMSAVVITHDPEYLLLTKGAPDVLFSRCNRLKKSDGSNVALTDEFLAKLNEDLEKFSMEGLRVIGCAIRPINEALAMKTREDHFDMGMLETEMIFVGFIGLMDPPRPEVPKSIAACKAAGIKVAMITGDHPNTALAIARSIGIVESHQSRIIKGSELDSMSDGQLKEELGEVRIFARVDPESKMRIVNQLQRRGEIVAMTGDGVNDAPALKQAEIGVAMGKNGTDAAREASDIVLADDNFSTLVNAVEEGRIIADNVKKFIGYLLASNTGEVILILLAFFIIGLFAPRLVAELSPLSATQILYMNLVTDSFLAIALGLEIKEKGIMSRPPRDPNEPIVNKTNLLSFLYTGIILSIGTLALYLFLLGDPRGWTAVDPERLKYAKTMAMSLIIFMETFVAVSYRSEDYVHRIGFFSNKYFTLSFLAVYGAHVLIVYVPFLRELFNLAVLQASDWVFLISIAFLVLLAEEFRKFALRRTNHRSLPEGIPS